jgi:hypothetical protein
MRVRRSIDMMPTRGVEKLTLLVKRNLDDAPIMQSVPSAAQRIHGNGTS